MASIGDKQSQGAEAYENTKALKSNEPAETKRALPSKDASAARTHAVAQPSFFIPPAPGEMPESVTINKVKADIQKIKEKIAKGEAPESLEAAIVIKAKQFEQRRQFDAFGNIVETQKSRGSKEDRTIGEDKSSVNKDNQRFEGARKVAEIHTKEQNVRGDRRTEGDGTKISQPASSLVYGKGKDLETMQAAEKKEIIEIADKKRQEAIQRNEDKTETHIEEAKADRRQEMS